jgi:hypothetical protein
MLPTISSNGSTNVLLDAHDECVWDRLSGVKKRKRKFLRFDCHFYCVHWSSQIYHERL